MKDLALKHHQHLAVVAAFDHLDLVSVRRHRDRLTLVRSLVQDHVALLGETWKGDRGDLERLFLYVKNQIKMRREKGIEV